MKTFPSISIFRVGIYSDVEENANLVELIVTYEKNKCMNGLAAYFITENPV